MATYLITGTSKPNGIGFELTKQLLSLPQCEVSQIFAVTRRQPSQALADLIENSNGRVVSVSACIDDAGSVKRAAKEVESHVGCRGLDVLVNNAGIGGVSPCGQLVNMQADQMEQCFNTNVVGAHRMIAAFLPLLRQGQQKKVINISSQLGSIYRAADFAQIPTHAYKISKAALHMLSKQYATTYDSEGFTFVCVSPGHLKTDMTGGQGDFEVEVGVREVKRIILEVGRKENGMLLNIRIPGWEDAVPGKYNGGEIAW